MKNTIRLISVFLFLSILLAGCKKEHAKNTDQGDQVYDINSKGIPEFIDTTYIELERIAKVSKFRSSYGHDYSHEDVEKCRSMKHYFWPSGGDPGMAHDPSWTTIKIFAPMDGIIDRLMTEWLGTQIWIRSKEYPAFVVRIFHVNIDTALKEGDELLSGQLLGTNGGDETMSDIAVVVNTPDGFRLLSYFNVITDEVFAPYLLRGATKRSDFIISKEARDADPLTCDGETFISNGTLENWVVLNMTRKSIRQPWK